MIHKTLFTLPILEYAKGGGGYTPPPPDPMAEARARDWESQQQAARDKADRDYQDQKTAEQHAKDVAASQQRLSSGYDAARSYGTSKLTTRGLDPGAGYGEQVNSLYQAALDRARANAPEIVNDANSIYTPSLYDDAYGTVRSGARTGLNKQLNAFMGDGFDYNTFGDNADDDIINSILGVQKTDAMSALDAAKARGQINDVGYQRGLTELANEEAAGRSKANQLGLGVISNYRKGLTDYAGQQRTKVDNYDLGDDFNVDNVKNRLDTMTNTYKGSLEGDIRAALGDQSFFNTDTLIGKAGNASGVTNNAPVAATTSTTGLLGQPLSNTTASGNSAPKKTNESF